MSVQLIDAVLKSYPGTGNVKLALVCLANFANDSGQCWPSIATVAKLCGCTAKQARRHVHTLIEQGLVAIESGTGKGGRGLTPRYRINVGMLNTPAGDSVYIENTPSDGRVLNTPTHGSRTVKNRHKNSTRKGNVNGAAFEQFWNAYPKRRGKAQAEKAWKKLNPSPELQQHILETVAVQRTADDWQRDGGQFIPYPASWLNGRRWEDELAADPKRERKVAL